ncbi:MAG TPA: glycerol-3-phosphate dehydrogenase/oxidase [Candidatus Binatia bacterium]|nr:glycerol-3-phosphate dehydrogenase/oxidase [Candidatus Binatia bacterium]
MSAPFPLLRQIAPLRERTFDVLVIGGGIYGAWTAYDAALRGLSVALIEQDDWASGTSSASSKLIHGGLRYLEHYDFALVRHALGERRLLQRMAPHLVQPLEFVLPVWKGPRASMWQLSAGLHLYDLLGGFSQPVPRHRRYSAAALRQEYPYVDPERLLGGFRYGDCQEDDARMTLAVVAAAQGAGAWVASRVQALELLREDGTVCGARVHDRFGDARFELRARCVVNAAGPWAPALAGAAAPKVRRVKGTHLVLPAIPGCREAFLLTAQDGRVFFVIPWYGRTLVGTTEADVEAPSADPTDEETRYLLAGARSGLPGIEWTERDVLARFAGIRTLQAEDAADPSAITREFEVTQPEPGHLLPIGGKFTTARCDAIAVVDRVERALSRPHRAGATHRHPLPGCPETVETFPRWQQAMMPLLTRQGVDAESAQFLTQRHGQRIGRIGELLRENRAWAQRLVPEAPFIAAEAVLAVRDEMALSLTDVLRRRLPLALVAPPPRAALRAIAGLLAPELHRDPVEIIYEHDAAPA